MTGWRYIFRLKEHEGKYDGVTSFGETFVLADENGAPLHPAMLYMAPRGAKECRELEETLGSMRITSISMASREAYLLICF